MTVSHAPLAPVQQAAAIERISRRRLHQLASRLGRLQDRSVLEAEDLRLLAQFSGSRPITVAALHVHQAVTAVHEAREQLAAAVTL